MKIGLDVSRLYTAQTGVSVYTRHLSEHLQHHTEHEFVLLSNPKSKVQSPKLEDRSKLAENSKLVRGWQKVAKHARHVGWTQGGLPWAAARAGCARLLCPEVASPMLHIPRMRTIATVHDTIVRLYPDGFDPRWRSLYHAFDENSLRFAHRIICDSASTRQDLLRLLPHLKPERVRVVHLAAAADYQPLPHDAAFNNALAAKSGLVYRQYVLYVGARNVRKNLPRLVQAFSQVAANRPELALVLAGPSGGAKAADATPQILAAIEAENLTGRVHLLENRSDAELAQLYNGAAAFVFPSLYEGFGLPPLEAMSCGAPVLCSRNSSLPEVVGDAALYLEDPTQISEIAARLETLLSDPALCADLRAKGLAQAARFSWAKTARETLAVLLEP